MAIKDILVHIGGSARKNCADLAASIAAKNEAHLVGLHVTGQPDIPPYIEAQLGAEVLDVQAKFAKDEATRSEALFTAAVEAQGVSSEWRVAEGDPLENIQLHARYADIAIIGQANPDEPGPAGGEDLAGRLALSLGRPVLAVPYAGSFDSVGKRVMVAWDAGRAAARALGDALPMMKDAEEVSVLSVNPETGPEAHGEVVGMDIAAHLARHGIKADAQHVQAHDMEVGAMLLSRAADFGADLIVMGAYGHARWRELVMGGATRHILEHMTVPVLMSH